MRNAYNVQYRYEYDYISIRCHRVSNQIWGLLGQHSRFKASDLQMHDDDSSVSL